MAVVIETTLGDVTVDLFVEERPRACLNFLKLCKLKYYNFNLFHTIERDFIAQTGDPNGAGDGGESIWGVVEGSHKRFFEAESLPKIKHTVPGLLSLVSVGKFMVGSQFFFTLGSDLTSLDGIHCVIGEVVEGHEVLRKLNEAIVDEKFRPYQDIRVTHTVILDDPFSDPRGFQVPSRSPSPSAERLQNGRIGADEDIDDTEGKTMEEIQEMLAEREAKARATILEIVGDLPDADIAPPENVLFVCKLNPVTTDDDLEIIFSRFGKVKSCEVIRDKVSGDSLQYAFVEFEEQKSCEAAYFKMDNVLIDDRRIHVDFSQSVSKVQWRGKGRGVVHADERDKKMDFNNFRDDKRGDRRGGGEKRRQRDRSRSPNVKNDNRRGGRRNDERAQDDRRRSPAGRSSPDSKKREERGGNSRYRVERSPNRRRPSPDNDRRRSPANEGKGNGRYAERSPNRRRPSLDRERRRSPDTERNGRQLPDRRRASPVTERRRSPGNDRRRPDERRFGQQPSSYGRQRFSPTERQRPLNQRRREAYPPERNRLVDSRTRSPPRNDIRRYQGDNRNAYQDPRAQRNYRRDQSPPPVAKSSNVDPSSDESDRDSKKKPKIVKSSKVKAKKRKKPATSSSSSSSSESETDSSSSSTSSSEEEKRRKAKKSKKTHRKDKKRPKKKSKRHNSSSSSD